MKVYLDNSSTTKVDFFILEKMLEIEKEFYGNPSSVHYEGQKAKIELENAREDISKILGCKPSELIFTSSGTEANNLAIKGVLKKGSHAIFSSIEHSSVLDSYKNSKDIEFSILPVNEDGIIKIESLKDLIKENTTLISIMHANNEIGTIQPIKEVKEIIKESKILFHVDSVQTIGKIDENPLKVADLCSFTAHKIHGPKGIGALYIKKGVEINKLISGGDQEWNKRAGTENLRAVIGLREAIKSSFDSLKENYTKVKKLRDYFESCILKEIENSQINGNMEKRTPYISNIYFPEIRNDILLFRLDMESIYASAGSACASGSVDPSHVLKAINLSEEKQKGSIRFSFSKYNSFEEIDYTIEKIKKILKR